MLVAARGVRDSGQDESDVVPVEARQGVVEQTVVCTESRCQGQDAPLSPGPRATGGELVDQLGSVDPHLTVGLDPHPHLVRACPPAALGTEQQLGRGLDAPLRYHVPMYVGTNVYG